MLEKPRKFKNWPNILEFFVENKKKCLEFSKK